MNLDHSILTLILFTPLAGAILLALLPERGKIQQATALVVTLVTFLCTLHLPARFDYAAAAAHTGTFQFVTRPASWIASPAIRYHLGVDGLSMWLVVLTGLLAPLGVLASWNAISSRTRPSTSSSCSSRSPCSASSWPLDLFLYYAFWELALVPMTILIATFGRTQNRRRAAIRYFLYAFIPSAIFLVGILWLYAQTGTFDVPTLAAPRRSAPHPVFLVRPLALPRSPSCSPSPSRSPSSRCTAGSRTPFAEAPTAPVMVLAGKLGLYSIFRFSFGIFPEQSHRIAPLMIALGAIGIVYGALLALIQRDLKRLAAFATLSALGFIVLGSLLLHHRRPRWRHLPDPQRVPLGRRPLPPPRLPLRALRHLRHPRPRRRRPPQLPWMVTIFVITTLSPSSACPCSTGFVGEFLILSGSMQAVFPSPRPLDRHRHHRRHLERRLHALDHPARLLRRARLSHLRSS